MDNPLQIFKDIESEEEDNWEELKSIVLPKDVRQPGDIDTSQIMKEFNIKGFGKVKREMDKAAASGKFLKLYVFDPDISRYRWILRRVKDKDE